MKTYRQMTKQRRFTSQDALTAFMASAQARGQVWHATVLHAREDCTPSLCRCEPEYLVEPATVEVLVKAEKDEREWLRGKRN